jgi:hypothetical protein
LEHLERFFGRLEEVKKAPSGWMARCPCPNHGQDGNGDGTASLSISLGDDNKIILHCFAGCTPDAVLDTLDLTFSDLWPTPGEMDNGDGVARSATAVRTAAGPSDSDLCHRVYSSLLGRLTLSAAHRQNLRGRGLDDRQIDLCGYCSLSFFAFRQHVAALREEFGDALLRVPGFARRGNTVTAMQSPNGIIIPVRDAGGHIIALLVRRDDDGGDGKYLWFSGGDGGTSSGSPVHVPRGVTPGPLVRITEGALKADVVFALSGVPTVGVAGVAGWKPVVPLLRAWGTTTARLAFDADAATKAAVARQLHDLARALTDEGLQVQFERWPLADGKGIDDVLAAGKAPEVLDGAAARQAIGALLQGGGAEHAPGAPSAAPETPGSGDGDTFVDRDQTLPGFPVDVFPHPVREFALKQAAAIGCPVDFVAHAQVAVAAAAIGDSRVVSLGGGWFESARLFGCMIGPPGSAKSPAVSAVVRPVYRRQRRLDREFGRAWQAYEQQLADYEAQVKRAGRKSRRGMEAEDLPEAPVPPTPVRIVTTDATVESLAMLLRENPRGLLMHRDELAAWVRSMDMYRGGRGSDRQFYLQVWSGEDVVVDRKSQGTRGVCVERPFMAILGSIQPDMLTELADARGRQDGFLDRILFSYPNTVIGQPWPTVRVSREDRTAWANVVRRLYSLKLSRKKDGGKRPRVLQLTTEAEAVLRGWWERHQQETQAATFDTELLAGPYAKFKAHVARLALVLHCLRRVCGETNSRDIDDESARRATVLADYYKGHCRKVHARLQIVAKDRQAERVEAWIRRNGGRCTARDLYRQGVAAIKTKSDARKALHDLEDRGRGDCTSNKVGKKESIEFVLRV